MINYLFYCYFLFYCYLCKHIYYLRIRYYIILYKMEHCNKILSQYYYYLDKNEIKYNDNDNAYKNISDKFIYKIINKIHEMMNLDLHLIHLIDLIDLINKAQNGEYYITANEDFDLKIFILENLDETRHSMQLLNCSDDNKQKIINKYITSIYHIIHNTCVRNINENENKNENNYKILYNGISKRLTYNFRDFILNIRVIMNGSNDEKIKICTSITIDYFENEYLLEKYIYNEKYNECIIYNNFMMWYKEMLNENLININVDGFGNINVDGFGDFNKDNVELFCSNSNYDENIIKNKFTPLLSSNTILNYYIMKKFNLLNKTLFLEFLCKYPHDNLLAICNININYYLSYGFNNIVRVNYNPI